jgi:hypothetical protein
MGSVVCPNCRAEFLPHASFEVWCEECGKRVPNVVLREAGLDDSLMEGMVTVGTFQQKQLAERAQLLMSRKFGAILELSSDGGRAVWAIRVLESLSDAARRYLASSPEAPADTPPGDAGCYLCGKELAADDLADRVCRLCRG